MSGPLFSTIGLGLILLSVRYDLPLLFLAGACSFIFGVICTLEMP